MPRVSEIFADEIRRGLTIFTGGKEEFDKTTLSGAERNAITRVFRTGIAKIRKVSPKLASDLQGQESIVLKVAEIFKEIIPEKKSYTYPCSEGVGVTWLFPQAVKYTASPTSSLPAYTDYVNNSWNINLTAGTPAYIFGSAANFYRACPTTGSHAMLLVFNNGIIEVGSTPKIQQFKLVAEGVTKYGAYTTTPLNEIPIESNVSIYQYETPMGAMIIPYDRGVKLSVMPEQSGVATIKLLGMVFYEYDFLSDLKWI